MTQSIVKTTKDGSLNTWSQWFRFDECLKEREADITFNRSLGCLWEIDGGPTTPMSTLARIAAPQSAP